MWLIVRLKNMDCFIIGKRRERRERRGSPSRAGDEYLKGFRIMKWSGRSLQEIEGPRSCRRYVGFPSARHFISLGELTKPANQLSTRCMIASNDHLSAVDCAIRRADRHGPKRLLPRGVRPTPIGLRPWGGPLKVPASLNLTNNGNFTQSQAVGATKTWSFDCLPILYWYENSKFAGNAFSTFQPTFRVGFRKNRAVSNPRPSP